MVHSSRLFCMHVLHIHARRPLRTGMARANAESRKEVRPLYRGLAKICAAANIPVPARGYWAKLQAGKHDKRWPLPARALGQPDVGVGRTR